MKTSSNYKDILINLTLRNLNIRYKGSVLGFFWAFLGPILTMVILSFVFSRIMRIQIEKYPLFLLSAILPWTFFSTALLQATTSIIENANLVKKVYFPREVLPIASVMSNFANLIFGLLVFIPVLIIYKGQLSASIILLPIILIIHLLFTVGLALFLSCANVYLRDVSHLLGVALMLWFYITPIFYPLSMVPRSLYNIYMLNPMVSIITMYRNVLFDGRPPLFSSMSISFIITIIVLAVGYITFRKHQPGFAKEI